MVKKMNDILNGDWKRFCVSVDCYTVSIVRKDRSDNHGTLALFFGTQMVSVRRFRRVTDICKIACNMIDRYIEKKGFYRYLKMLKISTACPDDYPLDNLATEESYYSYLQSKYVDSLRQLQNNIKEDFKPF